VLLAVLPSSELHIAEDWYRRTALCDLLQLGDEADRCPEKVSRSPAHRRQADEDGATVFRDDAVNLVEVHRRGSATAVIEALSESVATAAMVAQGDPRI